MGKATGDEELKVVLAAQLHRHMLPESGAADADVYRDVEHAALKHTHEFTLGESALLVMQAADYSVGGAAFVILTEADRTHSCVEITAVPGFEEVAPFVSMDCRVDYLHSRYACMLNFHVSVLCIF